MNESWPSRMLCPVDFSEASAAALRLAARLTRGSRSAMNAIYAHSWEAPAYFTESRLDELNREFRQSMREADRALAQFVEKECPGCAFSRAVVDARPVDGILRAARESGADLLVMGTHGRSGWNRLLLGSVTERVLREATTPVLTVRPSSTKEKEGRPISRILCPVNDTVAARSALEAVARLAGSLKAELKVLHVAEGKGTRPDLCAWLPESARESCRVEELEASGEAADQILRMARATSADLLVIGAQHRAFVDATVIGTTTVRVVRHSPVPVLTVVQR